MATTWRCGLLGTGAAGESNLAALAKSPLAKLTAIVSSRPERANQLLAKYGVTDAKVFSDLQSLLAANLIDVLVITTPSGLHSEPAIMALQHKVHVICEKPLEITLKNVDAMIAVAKDNGVRLAGIFQNRWNPSMLAIKHAVDAGRFGEITWAAALVLWHRDAAYYRGWRGTPEIDGGAAIMNQTIHTIDLLQWIAGPIKRVAAFSTRRLHKQMQAEDTLSATVEFHSGALGTIVGTTAASPQRPARIEIAGTRGIAVVEGSIRQWQFQQPLPDDESMIRNSTEGVDLLQQNIDHILDAWSKDQDSTIEASECRHAVQIVLALYESAANGGRAVNL